MDDSTLWERWTTVRDANAFAEIVSRHAGMVHSVSRRILRSSEDAEDVAQDCFLELLRTRPVVHSSMGALLHTLAVRRSLDRRKGEARRRAREARASEVEPREADSHEEEAELAEVLERVDEAMEELPDSLRGAIVLRFLEGRSLAEVSASLRLSESTVRLRIEKGLTAVRSALKRRGIAVTGPFLIEALHREALEAAPPGLIAFLGKIAVSGGAGLEASSSVGRGAAHGGILSLKKTIAIAAALCLAAIGWLYTSRDRLPPRQEEIVARSPGAAPAAGAPVSDRVASPDRRPVATESAEPATAEPAEATGRRIAVLCKDESGRPVAGAEVFLVERIPRSAERIGESISHGPRTTDGEGLAVFGDLSFLDGLWRLEAFARAVDLAGVGGMHGSSDDPAGEALEVLLVPAARLHGSVETPGGHDPRTVTVRVRAVSLPSDGKSPLGESVDVSPDGPLARALETKAGADGAFAFDGFPLGAAVHLEAEGPGLSRVAGRAAPPWEDDVIHLRLAPEGAIEGTLHSAVTGLPSASVRLEARQIPGEGSFRAEVDPDGGFRFEGLPEGSYSIALDGIAPPRDLALRVAGPIRVAAGETAGGIALLLERAGVVSGRVMDAATGAPIAGISIGAIGPPESGSRPVGAGVSLEDGSYSISLPPGGSTLYVADHVPEFVYPPDQGKRLVTLDPGGELVQVDFGLERRAAPEAAIDLGRARGRVLDPNGRPLARVRVRLFTLHDPARPVLVLHNRTVLTDPDGRYEAPVPAGLPVHVEAGGHLHGQASPQPFTVAKDGAHAVEDLVVRPAEGTLHGVVVGPGGAPVEGAAVRSSSKGKRHDGEPAITDAAGRFRVDRLLEDEPQEVTVVKEGYARLRVGDVLCAGGELRLVLAEAEAEPDGDAR